MLKAWSSTTRQGVASRSIRSLSQVWAVSPGAWITGAVILFIGIQAIRVHVNHAGRDHRQKIAAAFGGVNTFIGVPQMNHDGSRVTYAAITETRSCALYLYDALTKQRQEIVREETGLGYWTDDYDLRAWAWSPDDSSFIYSMMDKLVICPADSQRSSAELTVGTNAVSQVVWLNPAKFAYVEHGTNLCYAQKQPGGRWQQHRVSFDGKILSLTAVATNAVAWLQEVFICRVNLDENLATTNNPFLASTPDANAALPTKGLALWLDASSLQQSNNAPVYGLADLSHGKNSAIADQNPPTYNAPDSTNALNGKGTIHFESGASIKDATGLKTIRQVGIVGSQPRTFFSVMRRDFGKGMVISTGDPGTKGAYFGVCDQWHGLYLPAGMLTDNRFAPLAIRWNILSVVYDGTSQKGFVNGALKGTTTFPMDTPDTEVELGLRTVTSGFTNQTASSDGDFAELLIYDRALDTTEQRQVEDYLTRKWFGGRLLTAQSPLVWIDPQTYGITGFTRSKSTGQLLISVNAGRDTTLWRYDFNTGMSPLALTGSIQNAQWVGPNEFAYIDSKSGHKELVFADGSGTEKSRLFEYGNVDWFNPSSAGGKLLFSGVASNEPVNGIWQYDVETGRLQSLVPYSDHPSDDVKKITPFHKSIKSPSGRSVSCIIYPPATVDRHKKYPLVISDTWVPDAIHGPMFYSGIAACGAYVAIVERRGWWEGIEQWAEDVLALYQNMKQDPAIDFRQVYIFGASGETRYMSEFVEKTPGLWKGIILLNPVSLPNFSKSSLFQRRPKILICAGGKEHQDELFKKYQEDALKDGVIVEYIIQPGETHRFIGKAAKLERAKAAERFIFEE
jgi:hypothetical protein